MAGDKILSGGRAFKDVADFTTFKDRDGFFLDFYQEVYEMEANAAIVIGQVLTRVQPTTANPLRVAPVAAGASGTFLGSHRIAGIAISNAAGAGRTVQIVKFGFCLAEVGAGTAAAGDAGVLSATAGQVDVIANATGVTAGTFVGNVLGQFLGVKNTAQTITQNFNGTVTNYTATLAPFWFQQS